jgi:lipopolysaccharide/colanic/teichoic acid biosynthesis glycosyltransferase
MPGWGFFHRRHSESADAALAAWHPPQRFRHVLLRERFLVDRFGGEFSLLAFASQKAEDRAAVFAHLALCFKKRLRFSDEIGWMDEACTQVGVAMHRTPAAEACMLADEVCRAFCDAIPTPRCEVYCYPTDPQAKAEGGDAAQASGEGRRSVSGMERLFAQSLPAWKRGIDIIGALLGLTLLAPLMLITLAAVKLTSRGPVFYHQKRTGLAGRPFYVHKFRSMTVDADENKRFLMAFNEQDGPAFKIANDPRVTFVGRFIRATNIDELPQLYNVLRGEMSLVGPRPLPCNEAAACSQWQRQRQDVTPGLTCTWQILGFRDSFDDWMRLDIRYVYARSLFHDLALIFKTVPVAVMGRRKG